MNLAICGIKLTELVDQACIHAIHAIHKLTDNIAWHSGPRAERMNVAHHGLIVCVDWRANKDAITICVTLCDELDSGLRLIRIASAQLFEDRLDDVLPTELEYFLRDFWRTRTEPTLASARLKSEP